jgi:hypothetical protein
MSPDTTMVLAGAGLQRSSQLNLLSMPAEIRNLILYEQLMPEVLQTSRLFHLRVRGKDCWLPREAEPLQSFWNQLDMAFRLQLTCTQLRQEIAQLIYPKIIMEVRLRHYNANEFDLFTGYSLAMIRKVDVDTFLLHHEDHLGSIRLAKLFGRLPALQSIRVRTRFNSEPMLTGTMWEADDLWAFMQIREAAPSFSTCLWYPTDEEGCAHVLFSQGSVDEPYLRRLDIDGEVKRWREAMMCVWHYRHEPELPDHLLLSRSPHPEVFRQFIGNDEVDADDFRYLW